DLARRDLLAAAIDDLLLAAGDGEIALLVEDAEIAGAEPAVGEAFLIGLGVVLVARRDIGSPDYHLALGAGRQPRAVVGHDRDIRTGGDPDRARLARPRRQRIGRHLVRRLGHAVALDDRRAEGLF